MVDSLSLRIYRFVTTMQKDEGKFDSLYLIRSYDHIKRVPPDASTKPTPQSTTGLSRANTGSSEFGSREKRKEKGLPDVNHERAQSFEVWEVARAATAAPLYFEPMKIESTMPDKYTLFTDGGFGISNNPVRDAKIEIEKLHGDTSIGIVVSVGTARKNREERKVAFWSTIARLARYSIEMTTCPETNHDHMQHESTTLNEDERRKFSYYRLNHPGGLQTELDEWKPKKNRFRSKAAGTKTIDTITNVFNAWAKDIANRQEFQACAAKLVARRRLRKDTLGWEQYATGARYECREINCFGQYDRSQFVGHLRSSHKELDEQRVRDRELCCKKDWRYQRAREPTQR